MVIARLLLTVGCVSLPELDGTVWDGAFNNNGLQVDTADPPAGFDSSDVSFTLNEVSDNCYEANPIGYDDTPVGAMHLFLEEDGDAHAAILLENQQYLNWLGVEPPEARYDALWLDLTGFVGAMGQSLQLEGSWAIDPTGPEFNEGAACFAAAATDRENSWADTADESPEDTAGSTSSSPRFGWIARIQNDGLHRRPPEAAEPVDLDNTSGNILRDPSFELGGSAWKGDQVATYAAEIGVDGAHGEVVAHFPTGETTSAAQDLLLPGGTYRPLSCLAEFSGQLAQSSPSSKSAGQEG